MRTSDLLLWQNIGLKGSWSLLLTSSVTSPLLFIKKENLCHRGNPGNLRGGAIDWVCWKEAVALTPVVAPLRTVQVSSCLSLCLFVCLPHHHHTHIHLFCNWYIKQQASSAGGYFHTYLVLVDPYPHLLLSLISSPIPNFTLLPFLPFHFCSTCVL